jgi:N,N'-diacetyllegionaminate synthase
MIIAEIGINHLGCVERCKSFINKLVNTNVDGITLQVREPEYYVENTNYKLEDSDYIELIKLIHSYDKKVGIALADISKIDIFESIGVDFYKVIRNDITNRTLIKKLIETNKKLIISTGTSSDSDIENFTKYIDTEHWNISTDITLNHTQLSNDVEDCNLRAIEILYNKYPFNVSYGNHCSNHIVLYMSLCYKPSDILFYIKGDDGEIYPDDKHAILLSDVVDVTNNIINLSKAIGSGIKKQMKIKIK